MNCIEHQLKSCESLLSINNGSLLNLTYGTLNLLNYNGSEEVGLMFRIWLGHVS
jgi:hypothetical protein